MRDSRTDDYDYETMLTVNEVAEMLNVIPPTLRTWVKRGQAPTSYRINGMIRFKPDDVAAWTKAQRT